MLAVQLAIDAVKGLVALAFEGHVPFVSRPTIVAPPITGSSPWTSEGDDFSVDTALLTPGTDLCGQPLSGFNDCLQWWTIATKAEALLTAGGRLLIVFSSSLQREALHAERVGPVCVEQFGRTDILLAYKFCESRES